MTRTLQLAAHFALPLDIVTSRNALLAMSGAGKSNLAVVLAEEMHRCRVPWIAIDPKGDWHGVRSSADGKGPGLDVPILGGEHGDLPLSPHAGARMAELVAAGKLAGVFDVSDFDTKADVSRFLIAFATTLLKLQRTPIHLFLEECADYLPQGGVRGQLDPLASACVGAMKKLATKGRFRGIGFTLISQRAAEVNKSALYQCETLIAMRVMGKRDKEAVRGWVEQHQGSDELLRSLPTLEDGEAWIWSPQRLKLMERVRVRRRWTFDSGRTPAIGEALVVPKLAPVDIEALRAELAEADDKASPSSTSSQGAKRGSDAPPRVEIQRVEVPVLGQGTVNALADAAEAMRKLGVDLIADAHGVRDALKERGAALPIHKGFDTAPEAPISALAPTHADTKPAKARRNTAKTFAQTRPAIAGAPPEGWTMEEEALYQKFKARLLEEAPALVKAFADGVELEVTIERKVVELDGKTLRGRLAQLVADDFFAEAKSGHSAFIELQRIGFPTSKPNVYRELDNLAGLGIVTKESDGYRLAPGAKVRLKKAG